MLGNSDRLAVVGVLGESMFIWPNDVATPEVLAARLSLGRSVGGRGAGPGFINWSAEYMPLDNSVSWVAVERYQNICFDASHVIVTTAIRGSQREKGRADLLSIRGSHFG